MGETIVCKFGGTSLADAECFRRVGDIIRADNRRRYIIVSAPGKLRRSSKVTDMLLSAHILTGDLRRGALNEVRKRFCRIAADLGISPPYAELSRLGRYAVKSAAAISSRGEYLSAKLLAEYTGIPFVDSAELFIFRNGILDTETTYGNLRSIGERAVIPGFYGTDISGDIITFPRGGSDITAAHVSSAAGADLYENWTDVDGFYTADPSVVRSAMPIPFMSFTQARLFAYLGAGVLHYDSIAPAAEAGIPIIVRNTFNTDAPGTLISQNAACPLPCIAAIPAENNRCLLSCANMTREQSDRIRSLIPQDMFICEYGDVLTVECPKADMPKLAEIMHAACI